MSFDSFDEILEFAIKREQEAYEFYIELATKMERRHMQSVFQDFAHEELGHKAKLLGIKKGAISGSVTRNVIDLKIGDYLVDVEPGQDIDYQQALVIAMKREKMAYKMYLDLADRIDDQNLKNIFIMLSNEEAKHKLRFELEYDEILTDN